MKIPKSFNLFGYTINIQFVKNLQYTHCANGVALFNKNKILLEPGTKNHPKLQSHIERTFVHELTHWILWVMDEDKLCCNEEFVDEFSRLLHQALISMKYKKNKK